MRFRIHDSNKYGKLTERRLARLEKRLATKLPNEYRDFMLAHNGGRPERQGFVVRRDGEKEESILECFFPIHDKPYRDTSEPGEYLGQPLDSVLKDFAREMPDHEVLPIGRDPCANLICLAYAGKLAGHLFFYDHEVRALFPLAKSFDKFLAGLREAVPEELNATAEGEQSLDAFDLGNDDDYKDWRLKDGTEFSCWVGGELKAGRKIAVWTTVPAGPIEYRVRQGTRKTVREWGRMRRQADGGNDLPTYRASVALEAGKYAIDFKVNEQEFSALKFTVE